MISRNSGYEKKKGQARKIHIALSEEVHKRLRVKCALHDVTIQNFVSDLLKNSVKDVVIGQSGKKAVIQEK